MLKITCDDAPTLRGLMAELGITSAQEVADIAIDIFNHCINKVVTDGVPYHMDLDQIHRISPTAIKMLRLTGQSRMFKLSMGSVTGCTIESKSPLTLEFSGDRFEAMRKWKHHLGLPAESRVLEIAVSLLQSAVIASRSGNSIIVYKKHSELHTRASHDPSLMQSNPPPSREVSLPN